MILLKKNITLYFSASRGKPWISISQEATSELLTSISVKLSLPPTHSAQYKGSVMKHHTRTKNIMGCSAKFNGFFCFVWARQPPVGHGLLMQEVSRSHNDVPQSVGLLWTSDQSVAQTSTWQHTALTTDVCALGGIRTHSHSRRAAADLHLRACGQWDRQNFMIKLVKFSTLLL
jgi:hypothetical protein